MPVYTNALAPQPSNSLAYPGGIGKRGGSLDFFVPLDYSRLAAGQFRQDTPQMREYAANVPVDVMRGRLAGLLGMFGDVVNQPSSFMPVRAVQLAMQGVMGQDKYPDTEQFLKTLPLAPAENNPLGRVANRAGSLVPFTPMEALQAARVARQAAMATGRFVAPKAGQLAEGYMQRMGMMPGIVPAEIAPSVNQLPQALIKPKAEVSPLGFYSAVEQQALNIPRKSGTGASFINDLMKGQDVKKYEIEAMGLDEFLANKPNVTKQEVQDFIASNRVNVQERQLGATVTEDPVGIAKRKEIFDKYEPQIQDLYRRIDKPEYVVYDPETNKVLKNYTNYDDALLDNLDPMGAFSKAKTALRPKENSRQLQAKITDLQTARDAEANAAYVVPEPTPIKYGRYQLPGGDNYREILLTLPNKPQPLPEGFNVDAYSVNGVTKYGVYDATGSRYASGLNKDEALQKFNELHGKKPYTSSHFNEPNILAHMRVNDRIDADGKKMLLIEEVQSDWHQAGREKGYGPKYEESFMAYYETKDGQRIPLGYGNTKKEAEASIDVGWKNQVDIKYETHKRTISEGVPDAPFKDTWHQLALKRAIKEAVDKGYDRIGLTTGKQQIDRFSDELRQNVDEINFQTGQKLTDSQSAELKTLRQKTFRDMTGTERAKFDSLSSQEGSSIRPDEVKIKAYKGGSNTFDGKVKDGKFIEGPATGKTVEEVFGKSMAKQIAEQRTGTIKGDDLTIGGEGMKKYYDEVYPAFLEKQGKKYGAKVGETRIKTGRGVPGGETVRYLDITPEMRKAVKEGQPLASMQNELANQMA